MACWTSARALNLAPVGKRNPIWARSGKKKQRPRLIGRTTADRGAGSNKYLNYSILVSGFGHRALTFLIRACSHVVHRTPTPRGPKSGTVIVEGSSEPLSLYYAPHVYITLYEFHTLCNRILHLFKQFNMKLAIKDLSYLL